MDTDELSRLCLDDAYLAHFLDREFDGRAGLALEFPLLVGATNRTRRRVFEKARVGIVAHAAWRPLCLYSGAERIRAAGIGLVTTHRAHRNRGLASRLVEACVQDAVEEGAEIALLFAPERALYRRLGFTPVGRERVSTIPMNGGASDQDKIRPGSVQDVEELLSLWRAHALRVERTPEEFRALVAIPGVRVWVREQAGRVCAYCIEGKGRDLRGFVHEWGGPAEALAPLLAAMPAVSGAHHVLSPETELLPLATPGALQALAQVRILRPERFGDDDALRVFGDPVTQAVVPIYIWGLDSV